MGSEGTLTHWGRRSGVQDPLWGSQPTADRGQRIKAFMLTVTHMDGVRCSWDHDPLGTVTH